MKIGILGGTFDPIHNGHLAVAEEVRSRLNLDEILFIPTGQPWRKADSSILPAEHRVEMVRLAIADQPYYQLSLIELDRGGPSYTLDTLTELLSRLGEGDEVFFVVGWDSLNDLPNWKAPERIIQLCRLVGVPRPGYSLPDLESLDIKVSGLSERVILLDRPEVDISASEIRERVARGLSIDRLVPEPVERYIREHRLYST
ncbi:MAG: nicotinate-nucleotide adenylyltransferase [Dehalococcoidales bacterium]|nr:MAG: nicotinate-nucleotide adenylyltransferase [Dehalococcoidales bacterium]